MEKENPFKKLGHPPREVPPGLKKNVMNDIATAKLMMDFAALFTSNYKATLEGMFRTNKPNKK